MAKKKKNQKQKHNKRQGIVYSTNPDYLYDYEDEQEEETLPPNRQSLRISLDRKKGNKRVTRIYEFIGSNDDLKALGKELQKKCGCGGAVKGGEILLQGDFRELVGGELKKMGYRFKFVGG